MTNLIIERFDGFFLYFLGRNIPSYISSDISFSVRDLNDIIELQIPSNDEFYHFQISIKTKSSNGIIASLYSIIDRHDLIIFLKDRKLFLKYQSLDNKTSQLIFNDTEIINDGQKHNIIIYRQISSRKLLISIDNRTIILSNISSLSLFFDLITIGGSDRIISISQFAGCFSNITYNYRPLVPEDIVKSDRYDCVYEQELICDRQISCNNIQPLQFCGQTDCSLVCTSSSPSLTNVNNDNKGSLRYFIQIESGLYEQLYLMIFTISSNAVLFTSVNGSIQVSIIIQVEKIQTTS